MSHFRGYVFVKDVSARTLLEPYDENLEVEPYISDFSGNISTYNPLSKYDYYRRLEDIDVALLKTGKGDDEQKYIDFWNETKEKGSDGWYKFEYYEDVYGSVERYVEAECHNSEGWCFVTPDGEWHQRGNMGWWACHDGNYDSFVQYNKEWDEAVAQAKEEGWECYYYDFHI